MAVHPIDSRLYGHQFSTERMRAIWSEERLLSSWLDVEAALAESQAELDMIPAEAAEEIAANADTASVPVEEVAERFRRTNLDTVAMIRTLADAVPETAREYVHWGATTTDVTETAMSIRMRESIDVLDQRLANLERLLVDLAEDHARTPVVARTHSQHALPMTFGLKVSIWARETRQCRVTLKRLRNEACVGKVTGAAGTYAAFGDTGPELERKVCEKLGLTPADVTIQVSKTRLKEYLHALGSIAGIYGRIANEIWNRQRTEIDELREPFDIGESTGSSTLAFKRNPFECEWVRGVADLVKGQANTIRELEMEDERDGTRFAYYRALVPEATVMTDGLLASMNRVLSGLDVDAARMRENLDMTRGFVTAESVMMALARRGAGKETAHEIIYDCANVAFDEGLTLRQALSRDGRASEYLDDDEFDALTDPENYLGESIRLVEETVETLRRTDP